MRVLDFNGHQIMANFSLDCPGRSHQVRVAGAGGIRRHPSFRQLVGSLDGLSEVPAARRKFRQPSET